MNNDPSPEQQRRDTSRLMLGGLAAAAALMIAIIAWSLYPGAKLPPGPGGATNAREQAAITGRGAPAQNAGESTVARDDPAGQDDPSGGRARAIKQSARPLTLTDEQRRAVWDLVLKQNIAPAEHIDFELMIGTAVPRQTELHDIPPGVTELMQGYWGDQFVLVRDKLVIIDKGSRRVAAIVPGVP